MELLERRAALSSLAGFAGDAARGDGRLVLLAGEAGVGKSALVERLAQDRPEARQLSQARPLSIAVIEDVHWADEATIDLLRFLGRRLRDARVLLIATYRDDGPATRCGWPGVALHAGILAALRSAGGADDARLAFHAEAAADAAAVLRYAPPAARRSAELASRREAAAQFERALRFAGHADPATRAGLHDSLAGELLVLDRPQDAADACEQALELWHATGDRLREGDTLRQLSAAMWNLCRRDSSVSAAEAAVAILAPLGPSRELAWAYGKLATPVLPPSGPVPVRRGRAVLRRRRRLLRGARPHRLRDLPAQRADEFPGEGRALG